MKTKILYHGENALAEVLLSPNEAVLAESNTLVGMSTSIHIERRVQSGQIKPYTHPQSGRETAFLNVYRAGDRPCEVLLAPRLPGEIYEYPLEGRRLFLAFPSFLAAHESTELDFAWRGGAASHQTAGDQFLRCSGSGAVLLSSFGSLHRIELTSESAYSVYAGHLVAFSEQIQLRLRQIGGVQTGRVIEQDLLFDLSGPGTVFLQTRSPKNFNDWIRSKTPPD